MTDTIEIKESYKTRHCEEQCCSGPAHLRPSKQRGNAMIYVLIALAMFGFLTMTLTRSNNQADNQDIDDEQATFYALELMEYATSAQAAVDMMLFSGSEIDDLDFVTPDDVAFNTTPPPNYHKLFHPQGGGLNHQAQFNDAIQNSGAASVWDVNNNINVEWTLSAQNDVVLTAYFLTRQICEIINKEITGSTAIPITSSPHADYFLNTGTTDFDTTECAACNGAVIIPRNSAMP
jgi:hypothetical protein